jgi:alkyl hydroperoxide reductase subunit AhpC
MSPPLLTLAVTVALTLGLAGCSPPAAIPALHEAAPAFDTVTMDGQPLRFPADGAGQARILLFWADWCRYCATELRLAETIRLEREADGLQILALNAGQDRAVVRTWLQQQPVGYPVLLDEDGTITRRYGVIGLPTAYFIDGEGVVRGKALGEMSAEAFRHQVDKLIGRQR